MPTDPSATCLECGGAFVPRARHGTFCSRECRRAWNNRRMLRGAEIYDLFMAMRFDRARANRHHVWRYLGRLASIYREEDIARRAGRPSWSQPAAVIERHPYLRAETIARPHLRARG